MSSTTSPSSQSSDLPWIIGSGLVFVPTVAWMLSSGNEKKHDHHAPKASKEHVKVAEAVQEVPTASVPEPPAAEPAPEPAPEEKPAETTPEPSAAESTVSDDDGVVISEKELEESINKAVDADAPKEAKAVETVEAMSSEPAPAPSESQPVADNQASSSSKKETTESIPPPVAEGASTGKKEAASQ